MKRSTEMTRRELMKIAALAAPALSGLPALLSAEEPTAAAPPAGKDPRGPLKVIVVGAGLAGLAAAYELKEAGHSVTVLEARQRPGGRVHTLREPFADGLYAEAGALDFSASYRNLMRYIKIFDIPLAQLETSSQLRQIYHLRGKKITVNWRDPKVVEPDWPFELTADEKKLGVNGMFQKYFSPVDKIGDPTIAGWKVDAFKGYDQQTLGQFLQGQGASKDAVELLSAMTGFGYGWWEVSALHRLLSDLALFYVDNSQTSKVILGGTDLVPKALAKSIGDRVWYDVPVTRIIHKPGSVRAVFTRKGKEEWLDADRLVCAAPVPALRRITFEPALPAAKREAVGKLEYLPVTRVYVQTDKRFWRDEGEYGGASTDLPIKRVYEQPFAKTDRVRGILESHVRGPEANTIAALDQKAQIAATLDGLEKIHPGVKGHYEVGTSVAWGTDPWAGGGYAWWKPGQLMDWMPKLAEPSGRIHFAGEHTSLLGRTMEGALESGNRAAREVIAAPRPASRHAG